MNFTVNKAYENTRLDKYIKKHFTNFHIQEIIDLIKDGKVLLNNEILEYNYRLKENDFIQILLKDEELPELKTFKILDKEKVDFIKSSIAYEDENLLIFNKKPGYVVHHNNSHDNGLVDMLRDYKQNMNFTFVNRIDRATSGLIIGSKNLKTTRELSNEIRAKKIYKEYYILVNGIPKEDKFTISTYLKKLSRKVVEVSSDDEEGKLSISHFEVLKRGENRSILRGILETGRTHQLRVHLANFGIPIVGDRKYGNKNEGIMHLFSHKIIIEKYDFELDLDYPDYFEENLK